MSSNYTVKVTKDQNWQLFCNQNGVPVGLLVEVYKGAFQDGEHVVYNVDDTGLDYLKKLFGVEEQPQ